ncbi:MAG: transporter [Moraxellaceae bacterium]|nr:MAG: transporter [Moraxellaceae bacterium]
MLMNLLVGLPVMVACLVLQSILMVLAIRYYFRRLTFITNTSIWPDLASLSGVMLLLVVGILGQIAIWALLFVLLDEFQLFDAAFYHSAVNFGSLGYGDVVMSDDHKLLGALEAINGVLMIGVSTAALMPPFKDAVQKVLVKEGFENKKVS